MAINSEVGVKNNPDPYKAAGWNHCVSPNGIA